MEIFNNFERLNTIVSGVSEVINIGNTVDVSASTLIPISGSFISSPTDIQFNGTKVTSGNPLPISGIVSINNFPTNQIVTLANGISGNVSVSNFPAIQGISAASVIPTSGIFTLQNPTDVVGVSSIPNVVIENQLFVSGANTIPTYFTNSLIGISGTPNVTISNPVTTVGISGTPSVSITNLPSTQTISGSVSILNPISVVGVSSIPNVTISNPTTVVGISGTHTVLVGNIVGISAANPISTNISNSIGVSSIPNITISNPQTVVGISGTVNSSILNVVGVSAASPLSIIHSGTQPISGSVSVLNPITTIGVSSLPNVTISNQVTTVGISGTPSVSISNLPSTQGISANSPIPVSGSLGASDLQFDGSLVTSSNPLPITGNITTSISDTIGVSAESPLNTNLTSNSVAYWPAQTFVQPGTDVTYTDPSGNIQVRGAFTSDEGSYSNDFNSSATYDVLIGTCIFTSGSTQVSGIGTQFTKQLVWGDHVRLSSDGETYFTQVLSVESDTLMTVDMYTGVGGTGTGYYFGFHPFVGTGGAISVTNSILRIDSGTTSGANTFIARDIDFQPTACIMRNFYITSNPNEVTPYYGFFDSYDIYSANAGAYVWFSNKELNGGFFITKTSKSVGAQSIIPFTLPNGAMITTPARWRIEVTDDSATLIYNDLIIATSRLHLPALYAPLTFLMGAYNETTSTVSCQMYLDEILFKNVDVINTASVLQTHVQNSSDYVTQEYLKELTSIVQLLVPTVRAMTNNVAMMVDVNGRQRTNVEAGTLTANCNINASQTIATVTTVSNQTNIAGYSAADQIPSLINMNGISLRDRIIVS